jgi:hypothetical protein
MNDLIDIDGSVDIDGSIVVHMEKMFLLFSVLNKQ